MKTKPFFALRPAKDVASRLASVPYDVVDTKEARALAAGNELSFLHVSRPEIDLDDSVNIYDDKVYAQAVKALSNLKATGAMATANEASYYAYRQIMNGHSQIGIVTCCHIDDYENDIIRKHEKTRQDKEDDRTRHCLELGANTGPVFLTYRDKTAIDEIVSRTIASEPIYDFVAPDGIAHTVWEFPQEENSALKELFEKVDISYVADGHHRAKAAWRAGSEKRAANPNHTGLEEYNWFLAVLFPASQLKILPYNRCVADLCGLSEEDFLAKVKKIFAVTENGSPSPASARNVSMYLGGKWYNLAWEAFESDPVSSLDVSVLQDRLLKPVLGIDDPRTSKRISFIGGIRGTKELENRVDEKQDAVAFSMSPVTVDEIDRKSVV